MIKGAKYFIKDKVLNYVLSAQILNINDVEISFKNLDTNQEFYREIDEVEKISKISEEEELRLNNQDLFSIQTELIRAIISRDEFMNLAANNFDLIKKDKNTVLISIIDPDKEEIPLKISSMFKNSLSLGFFDVEEKIGRFEPISKKQAKILKDFILKHKNDNFLIHCEAGMSRSAGVGLAVYLLVEHNGDKYSFSTSPNPIKEHHRYYPNLKILDMVSEA